MRLLIQVGLFVLKTWLGRRLRPVGPGSPAHPTGPLSGVPEFEIGYRMNFLTGSASAAGATPDVSEYPVSLQLIIAAMNRLGYSINEDDAREYNLNIVGVRNPKAALDKFECEMHVFWKFRGRWTHLRWPITTFPGSRYLVEKLLNPAGAAILVPGQYAGVYKVDLHGGKYRALCQRNGSVRVYRDGDRDRQFDLKPETIQKGSFGINIHSPITPGSEGYVASRVYAASAGCQVFQRVADFKELMAAVDHAVNLHGNQFTYTLITQDDLDPALAAPAPARPLAVSGTLWNAPFDTAGVRNKNLLNVKGSGWLYSLGTDSRGHNIFPSHAKGLRAGIITLRTYWTKHQKRSIAAILSRWAPASDTIGSLPGAPPNSPVAYSKFVGGRMLIDPTKTLRIFDESGKVADAEQLFALVSAMAAYENDAKLVLPRPIFDEALTLI